MGAQNGTWLMEAVNSSDAKEPGAELCRSFIAIDEMKTEDYRSKSGFFTNRSK